MKKYRDLTSSEFDRIIQMLNRLNNQIGYAKLKKMALSGINPNDYKVYPDHYYYVSFDNPVTNNKLYYIAISDSSRRLWLIKRDHTKCTYIKYGYNRYTYGWFAYNISKEDLENDNFLNVKPYAISNIVIKDIQTIKDDLVKYDEYLIKQEERYQESARKQQEAEEQHKCEQEERRKQQEEYARLENEFYKSIEGYTNIGYINPMGFNIDKEYIDLYNKLNDPDSWRSFNTYYKEHAGNRGRTYSDILVNDEYKIYYTVTGDSSD